MTDEQLAEWEALAEKATEGAWFIVPYGDGDTFVVHSDDEQRIFFPPLLVGYSATAGSLGDPAQIESDMKFIAASRTAIPSLIAEVKRLRAVVADTDPAVAELVDVLKDARRIVEAADLWNAGKISGQAYYHSLENHLADKAVVRFARALLAQARGQQEKDHG